MIFKRVLLIFFQIKQNPNLTCRKWVGITWIHTGSMMPVVSKFMRLKHDKVSFGWKVNRLRNENRCIILKRKIMSWFDAILYRWKKKKEKNRNNLKNWVDWIEKRKRRKLIDNFKETPWAKHASLLIPSRSRMGTI